MNIERDHTDVHCNYNEISRNVTSHDANSADESDKLN